MKNYDEKENDFEELDDEILNDSEDDSDDEISQEEIQAIEDEIEDETDLDIYFKFDTNNHKLEGKHSLKRDTIFNGKLTENINDEYEYYGQLSETDFSFSESIIEKGSTIEEESRNSEVFTNRRNLSRDIYNILSTQTDIDFKANRRRPNKVVFNDYYKLVLNNIGHKYTKSEIFVELSYFFTDNIFNTYKLLNKNYAMGIINELREKGYLDDIMSISFV
jgi:hypothetical protein